MNNLDARREIRAKVESIHAYLRKMGFNVTFFKIEDHSGRVAVEGGRELNVHVTRIGGEVVLDITEYRTFDFLTRPKFNREMAVALRKFGAYQVEPTDIDKLHRYIYEDICEKYGRNSPLHKEMIYLLDQMDEGDFTKEEVLPLLVEAYNTGDINW